MSNKKIEPITLGDLILRSEGEENKKIEPITLGDLILRSGGIAQAQMELIREGIPVPYITVYRWSHGKSKPGGAYREMLRRIGVTV